MDKQCDTCRYYRKVENIRNLGQCTRFRFRPKNRPSFWRWVHYFSLCTYYSKKTPE